MSSLNKLSNLLFLAAVAVFVSCSAEAQQTLQLSPENHHYLQYQERPIILVTSGEHYGALLNLDFDYVAYFDALQKTGMNNTRVFSGAYVERKNDIKFMQYGNTLAPKENRLIAPWKRSNNPGYVNGGNKFDLDQWDEEYFKRLKDLLTHAARKGIIIEFTLFGNQYNDSTYSYSPLYQDNNIQQTGKKGKDAFLDFQSLKDDSLVERQDAMVVKIVNELNSFDNIYYEISNEPYNEVKDSSVVDRWHDHIISVIRQTESPLAKKHLISTNQAVVDNPEVNVANYHYVHISNMPDFDSLLRLDKVVSMNETVGSLRDADVNDVRVEAWDFMVHGGGVYNNLSWEYTPDQPSGSPGSDTIRRQLENLQKFVGAFKFTKMIYSPEALIKSPAGAITRVMAEKGQQYMLYVHHSEPHNSIPKKSDFVSKYEATAAIFTDTIVIDLPSGKYTARWYDPARGTWIGKPLNIDHNGANQAFHTPPFRTDIALSIQKK